MAGLNKEVWISDIQEILTRNAAFLSSMSDWTAFVNNAFINIPQAGDLGPIQKNFTGTRTATQRVDANLQIPMDLYETGVTVVSELESYQLSYDKRNSVLGAKIRKMVAFAGDDVLQAILPTDASKIITVTGSLTFADLAAAQRLLNKDQVDGEGRSLVLDSDMYAELLTDPTVIRLGFNLDSVSTGKLPQLAGFTIYERAVVATTAGGKAAGVGYQKDLVGQAVGSVDMMIDSGDNGFGNPMLGGIGLNGFMKLGAGRARTDQKGTVALVRA